jgi:PAS domain S-box-containing protein
LKITRRNLVGKPLFVFIAQEDRVGFTLTLTNFKYQQHSESHELCLVPRRGATITTAVTVASAKDESGKDTLRWTLRDITERKRAKSSSARTAAMLCSLKSPNPR